ncbi:hypothetical protein EJ06DRAFT_508752 [Trichodelitschia bisporula]|uniref:DUF202 domain-containing protein n=1 Tax=Trichodelitschia bisporula TaxID=703511 RepID=A0A6G1HZS2_9PEZI|nr:hypothetical protein EJ06DRAFT_508752 [Trichodelitschia bisporula]
MATQTATEQSAISDLYKPIYHPFRARPVVVSQSENYDRNVVTERPWLGPLLFQNEASDARDHCANERTFLSWLRLSVYLSIVSIAIVISFHLKSQPSHTEKQLSLPLGIIFWLLSIACLVAGIQNYYSAVQQYSRRAALVQSGWKTELVFAIVAVAIIAACILFLATNSSSRSK